MVPRRRRAMAERKGLVGVMGLFCIEVSAGAYVLTAGLLLLLALLLYRFSLQERLVNISIIVIYIVVTFLAGWLAGKRAGVGSFCGDF